MGRESVGSSIHNRSHGQIADVRGYDTFPGDPRLDDADMGSPATAHHNEHFWGLHRGGLMKCFAEWQRAHGEPVEAQNPLSPAAMGHGHAMPLAFSPFAFAPSGATEVELSDETRRFFREVVFGG